VKVSVVIPTIRGREDHLQTCVDAYQATVRDLELIVVPDRPSCGSAWSEGACQADGEYVHFTCDDIEPQPGWFEAAQESVARDEQPAPRIVGSDGALHQCGDSNQPVEHDDGWESPFSSLPFMKMDWWSQIEQVPDSLHYFSDNWMSAELRGLGVVPRVNRDYLFVHHHAKVGRLDDRLATDLREYERLRGSL